MAKKFTRTATTETAGDRNRRDAVRKQVQTEYPPKSLAKSATTAKGIGKQIRDARTAQGLTWYAVAKQAGIPNSGTVRDIELGLDAKLSSVEAIAKALGLKLMAIAA